MFMNTITPIDTVEKFNIFVEKLIKLDLPVVSDFSGTLSQCNDGQQINESLFKVLQYLEDMGVKVIVASTEPDSSSLAMSFIAMELDLFDSKLTNIQDKTQLGDARAGLVFDDEKPDYLSGYNYHFDMSNSKILGFIDEIGVFLEGDIKDSKVIQAPAP